ncbi:MAG: radical SAM protein [Myxococcota bacterium]
MASTTPLGAELDAPSLASGTLRAQPGTKTLKVCLINPRFEPSYWGFEYALPLYPGDRRSTMINGALPTLAGLAGHHDVTLLDENVEAIDWKSLDEYDVVGVTGMNVQRERQREILERLKKDVDTHVIVGGPYASVKEEAFTGLYDTIFVGESDETWPAFLDALATGGDTQLRYEQPEKTDMTRMPSPRYDLLQVDRYASGALQFSRGCPFQCEFCDIIVIFGRRPRTKRPEQVIAELDEMRQAGFFSAMVVDDNFIGNKKEAKEVLRQIIPWQKKHNYPLRISTEASINLADDPELLELMYEANFRQVFIGIETPRKESLEETKKFQNTRGDSLEDKLARIQRAGLDIAAGFIVGFDSDDLGIFDDQYAFIQDNGIQLAMVGMLGAIPKTPLYERLEKDGRLVEEDPNCNFHPKQMTREELKENYWDLVTRLYTPEAFFDRYFSVYKNHPEFERKREEICERAGEGKTIPTLGYGLILLYNLTKTLIQDGSLGSVGKTYWRYFWRDNMKHRPSIIGFAQFMNRCVTHWHFYTFTREAVAGRLRTYNSG